MAVATVQRPTQGEHGDRQETHEHQGTTVADTR
jgi:hypothetical protein